MSTTILPTPAHEFLLGSEDGTREEVWYRRMLFIRRFEGGCSTCSRKAS
jgi:hypothetical protein